MRLWSLRLWFTAMGVFGVFREVSEACSCVLGDVSVGFVIILARGVIENSPLSLIGSLKGGKLSTFSPRPKTFNACCCWPTAAVLDYILTILIVFSTYSMASAIVA